MRGKALLKKLVSSFFNAGKDLGCGETIEQRSVPAFVVQSRFKRPASRHRVWLPSVSSMEPIPHRPLFHVDTVLNPVGHVKRGDLETWGRRDWENFSLTFAHPADMFKGLARGGKSCRIRTHE